MNSDKFVRHGGQIVEEFEFPERPCSKSYHMPNV